MCERWVEIHLRRYSKSSSGTIYTAAKKINRRGTERSQQLSIIGSNKNLFVR
ncbi:hypothetical protein LIPSTDRAFT_70394 [Lipomyces starkeyi NRRL Y-11557]|uniref:Uncharacterized protein n=1 Tax=Lipomyces starkeyi NRRL Y-11557 TaxID=675824 RepID=A0A1E3Q7E8_LIPST|nr:hypothetical protein LIPSTDRAFT_70394 [Lipomyces starkeyi NRRL Y-11557]